MNTHRPVLKLKRLTEVASPAAPAPAAPQPTSAVSAPPEQPVPGADVPWDSFHFVWAPCAFRPSRRFATEFAAQVEAKRLRTMMPAKRFLVYRAVCIDLGERT